MYIQLYTQPARNQVPKVQKPLRSKVFLDKYTKTRQLIAKYIIEWFRFPVNPYIKQETIAKAIGCSIRTVQRASDQFVLDGWLFRTRENRYSPYYLDVIPELKGQVGFEIRVRNLSSLQQDHFITTGKILSKYSIHKLSIRIVVQTRVSNSNNYIYNSPLYISPQVLKMGLSKKEMLIRSNKTLGIRLLKKELAMLTPEQKKYILDRKDQNGICEALLNAEIWKLILTETNEKLCALYGITQLADRFKLIPYREATLQRVYHHSLKFVNSIQKEDPLAYLIKLCNLDCQAERVTPDHTWYFQLCSLLDVSTDIPKKKKPITQHPQPSHNPIYQSNDEDDEEPIWPKNNFKSKGNTNVQAVSVRKLFPVFEGNSKVQTVSERSAFLEAETIKLRRNIDAAINSPFLKIMTPKFEFDLQNYEAELKQLRETL